MADKGYALERAGELDAAAHQFARAAALFSFEREHADALHMTERARSCWRAACAGQLLVTS